MPKIANFNVVEYIELDGNTHFTSGCRPTSGIVKEEYVCSLTQLPGSGKNYDLCGNWGTTGSGSYHWVYYNTTNGWACEQYNPSISDLVTNYHPDIGEICTITYTQQSGERTIDVNGTMSSSSGASVGNRDVWLFSSGPSQGLSKFVGRIYKIKIWDDTTLIGDFTPVTRKSDGLIGLWNTITDEVYYQGGHESFYGDIPWIQGEDLFPYNENFIPMPEKALSEPPDAIFRIDETDDLPHTNLAPVLNIPALTKPFPDAVFRIEPDEMGGMPFNKLPPDCPALGAFANANNLIYARIPATVQKLGDQSFTNTLLKQVKISQDCTFDEETFPKGCLIEYYK